MSNRQIANVWFQKLTLERLLLALWLGRGAELTVFAPQASLAATQACRLLAKIFGRALWRQVVVEMGEVNAQGRALRYDVEAGCAYLGNRLLECLGDLKSVLPPDYHDFEDDWRRLLRAHLVAHAAKPLTFLYFAANYPRRETAREQRIYVFISPRMLGRFIARNLDKHAPPGLRLHALLTLREIVGYLPLPGMLVLALTRLVLKSHKPLPPYDVPDDAIRQGLVIEQYSPHHLARYPNGGHLFWHRSSGFPARRVALFFNRHDAQRSQEDLAAVRRYGFSWIDGSNSFAFFTNALRDGVKALWSTIRFLPRRFDEVEFWRWQHCAFFSLYFEAFRAFARKFNVLMLHQCDEQAAMPLLLTMAVRKEGGMFLWNHWSVSHYPFAREGCGMADLLLAWGHYDLGFRAAMGFRHSWQALTGPVVGSTLTAEQISSAERFRSSFAPSVTFVIVVFDSSHGPETHQPTSTIVSFFKELLQAACCRPHWGLLMKTKKPDGAAFLAHREISEISALLESQGRLVALNSLTSPIEAAASADACVSYSINSAGIVCALRTDRPTLHCDIARISKHLLYQLGAKGKVLFQDVAETVAALDRLEAGDRSVGDFAPFRDYFDAYLDGMGNRRAGELLGAYLNERDKGLNREAALQNSLQNYSASYGADKVFTSHAALASPMAAQWQKLVNNIGFEPYHYSAEVDVGQP